MKIKFIAIVIGLFVFLVNPFCWAGEYEVELMAGDSTFETGMHYKHRLAGGFLNAGGYYLQTDDDDLEYQRWLVDFTFGSEMIATDMICEIGLASIFGDAEKQIVSSELVVNEATGAEPVAVETTETINSDLAAVAFIAKIGYLFPEDMLTFPFELYGRIIYAPSSICFGDTEDYLSYQVGVGVRIIEYVSFTMQYTTFDVAFESGAHKWDFDEDNFQLGLIFRF